jgi:hypothetical protein
MFEETDLVLNTKHFLQISQNLEFTYMQNFYTVIRNFDSVNQPLNFVSFFVLSRFSTSPVSYRSETYWWACADWKEVYKSTYFRVYSRIKIKSSSQVNFLAYYGSTNQSTFTKFWNLKTFLIRFGTVRFKWKTGFIRAVFHFDRIVT